MNCPRWHQTCFYRLNQLDSAFGSFMPLRLPKMHPKTFPLPKSPLNSLENLRLPRMPSKVLQTTALPQDGFKCIIKITKLILPHVNAPPSYARRDSKLEIMNPPLTALSDEFSLELLALPESVCPIMQIMTLRYTTARRAHSWELSYFRIMGFVYLNELIRAVMMRREWWKGRRTAKTENFFHFHARMCLSVWVGVVTIRITRSQCLSGPSGCFFGTSGVSIWDFRVTNRVQSRSNQFPTHPTASSPLHTRQPSMQKVN